jgi:hypothetical protein
MGMIKRMAFAYGNEVRMFITRRMNIDNIKPIQPSSTNISVNIDKSIEEIIILPFTTTSLKQSILAVCKCFGIEPHKVATSKLLENFEYLLEAYD